MDSIAATNLSTKEIIGLEDEYAAHTYHPLPVCFDRAKGVHVWDPEGKRYFDFLSAYSAVNQGHYHPKIIEVMVQQAQKCTLSSRAFYNSVFPQFARYITKYFGYEMVLPMNTGAEAVETSIKLARRWGHVKKGIPNNETLIVCCKGCFHGRTSAAIAMSDDPSCYEGFGALLPGFERVPYDDADAFEELLARKGKSIAAFIVEPIQGEAGVVVPKADYLRRCYEACQRHNVLFIADEIQTGLCRTGKMLCIDWQEFKPDIVILGKAISGGMLALSVVLADKEIMLVIKPGEHGSTYGGSPLASAVGMAALQVLRDENLAERANLVGETFRTKLRAMKTKFSFIEEVRGMGLLNAVVIQAGPSQSKKSWAYSICLKFAHHGILAKPTHDHIIRLAPPLVMTDADLDESLILIERAFQDFADEIASSNK